MSRTFSGSVLLVAGLLGLGWSAQNNEDWVVPADAKAMKNPVALNDAVAKQAADLYKKNCHMCHGDKGKGDGPATKYVKPAPADISVPAKQDAWTDGEIFWKISEGKNPMPRYEKKLSADDRWKLVHYVRSLKGK